MIEVNNWDRGTGKTTEVIKAMEEDEELYCIVPMNAHKRFYPEHLRSRILSGSGENFDRQIRGIRILKVVLDEGFMYEPKKLLELYYYLGYHHIDVRVYGTAS